jgi:hypothetical protein
MRFTNIEKLIFRVLSVIAIISFLILAITSFLVGIPTCLSPLCFLREYVVNIIFLQNTFLLILFISLIGIAFYNVKWIVIRIINKEKKAVYIISLIIILIYLILYYPYYIFTAIPMQMWYVLNFLGCIYVFSVMLVSDKKHIPLKSTDNSFFSLGYAERKSHIHNKNIIFSKKELSFIYILSFLIVAILIFFSIRLLYITKIFYGLYSISFNVKHHYKFAFISPEYLLNIIIFICFIGLLYFSIKGLWKGCIIYNLKKTFYIFPPFILFILGSVII